MAAMGEQEQLGPARADDPAEIGPERHRRQAPSEGADEADGQDHRLQPIEPAHRQQRVDEAVESDLDPEGPIHPVDPARRRKQNEGADIAFGENEEAIRKEDQGEPERHRGAEPDARHEPQDAVDEEVRRPRAGGRIGDDVARDHEEHLDADPALGAEGQEGRERDRLSDQHGGFARRSEPGGTGEVIEHDETRRAEAQQVEPGQGAVCLRGACRRREDAFLRGRCH